MPNMNNIGGPMPSGAPRNVLVDENNQPTSLIYWQKDTGSTQPTSNYHEEYIYPSGGLYATDGRTNSYGAVNLGQFKESAFYLDVTDMVRDDSDESLDVVLETSYNQGNSWTRFARFTTVETAGAQNQVLVVEASGSPTCLFDNDETDPASGTVLTAFLGDRIRAAGTFTDPAGADSSGVFSVYGVFKR